MGIVIHLISRKMICYGSKKKEKLNLLQRDFYREMEELDVHLRSLENTKSDKEYRGFTATHLTVPSNETYALGEEFPKTPSASGGAGGGASAAEGRGPVNASVVTGLSNKRTRRNRNNRSRKNNRKNNRSRKNNRKNNRSRRPKN